MRQRINKYDTANDVSPVILYVLSVESIRWIDAHRFHSALRSAGLVGVDFWFTMCRMNAGCVSQSQQYTVTVITNYFLPAP